MQYWLMKSEPDVWSIDQQKKAGAKGAPWDGVRNYQAAKNLKSMKKGDFLPGVISLRHSRVGGQRSLAHQTLRHTVVFVP